MLALEKAGGLSDTGSETLGSESMKQWAAQAEACKATPTGVSRFIDDPSWVALPAMPLGVWGTGGPRSDLHRSQCPDRLPGRILAHAQCQDQGRLSFGYCRDTR